MHKLVTGKDLACSWVSAARLAAIAIVCGTCTIASAQEALGTQHARSLGDKAATLVSRFAGHKAVSRPCRDAVMGFSLPTIVKEVLVKGGQELKQSELMIRGDDAEDIALLKLQRLRVDAPLAIDRARAAMEQARIEYERMKDAMGKGASGPSEVERAKVSWDIAKIDLQIAQSNQQQEVLQMERMQARVDRYRLTAPFDCLVDLVQVDVGQGAAENEKVIRVVDVDPLWIDVPSPTSDTKTLTLKPGDPAWVLCDVAGEAFLVVGSVIEVAPTADPTSGTRRVRVEVPNPAVREAGARERGLPAQFIPGGTVWVRFTPFETVAPSAHAAAMATKTPAGEAESRGAQP